MAQGGSIQLSGGLRSRNIFCHDKSFMRTGPREWAHLSVFSPSSHISRQDQRSQDFYYKIEKCLRRVPYRYDTFSCRCFALSNGINGISLLKRSAEALPGLYKTLDRTPLSYQLAPAVGVIAFTLWGLGPLMRFCRGLLVKKNENTWTKSRTYYIFTSYVRPLILWSCVIFICRALNPVTMPSEASQAIKQRLLNFVKSLSTVLTFSFCISSLIQELQKYFTETNDPNDSRNMGFRFAGKAVYTAVWVAGVSLFMELLGFSTQKWLTAGGLGTVLLTLAGREIFTNFLSSVMIHATRPFILNEWIQTRIEGYEVSGTVEHVGWWSPTVIRGEDREAVHIPNHKFTVTVVRNLSQKTHWRIKTHLAISHLDVNKISNIVADMRKVLAKSPQVEQRKLHRRIFLDNIDPENQALRILISCFVKTSHYEEYLCVKEAILLDLLRVISHHQARLATPIRTVHKVYRDSDLEGTGFGAPATNKTLLLIEPTTKINGEDKAPSKSATADVKGIVPPSSEGPLQSDSNSRKQETPGSGDTLTDPKENSGDLRQQKKEVNGEEAAGLNPSKASMKDSLKNQNGDKSRGMEENLVLGVAIDGAKRTLPIEESTTASDSSKELTALRRDKKDSQTSPPGTTVVDPHDQ